LHTYCSRRCFGANVHSWDAGHRKYRRGHRDDLGHSVRSTWEANVCRVLKAMGMTYQYEPRTFNLGDVSYTPDLLVNGQYWIEVKGWLTDVAAAKMSRFREVYPSETLIVVDKHLYAAMAREWADRIPNWEHKLAGKRWPELRQGRG